jgi:hypothetical protein
MSERVYAENLKRDYEEKEKPYRKRMQESGFTEDTPGMDRAMKAMKKAANLNSPDIPKLVSLRAAKYDNAASDYGRSYERPSKNEKAELNDIIAAARAGLSSGNSDETGSPMKKGGSVKKMASGGKVVSASKRADGIAQRGKTKGRMC